MYFLLKITIVCVIMFLYIIQSFMFLLHFEQKEWRECYAEQNISKCHHPDEGLH